jgi:hypothetical protein
MAWMVRYNEDGSVAEKERPKKGRPKRGWVRVNDDMSPTTADAAPKKRREPKLDFSGILSPLLVSNDDPSEQREAKPRGRTPKGFTKVLVDQYGELYDLEGKSLDTGELCPDLVPPPEQQEASEKAKDTKGASVVEAVLEQPKATVLTQTQEIKATSTTTLAKLQEHVDASRVTDEDGTVRMLACSVDSDPGTDYLRVGMTLSRIDAEPGGDIKVWREKPKGNPTVIIKGALQPVNV